MKSAILLIILTVIGKATGLGKDVLTTSYFGVSLVTDAFFLSTYISSLIYIALYGSISLIIVPAYQSYKKGKVKSGSFNFAILVMLVVSVFLSFISFIFSDEIIRFFYYGDSGEETLLASEYLKLMVITYPLSTCVGILNAISSVKMKPMYVYLNPVINNISFCVLVFWFCDGTSFEPILLGAIGAWFVILLVNLTGYDNVFSKMVGIFKFISPNSRLLLVSGVSITFTLVEQMMNFVPVYISSYFGSGAISYYSLASKLTLLFLSLSLLVINTHVYPKFSKMNNLSSVVNVIQQFLPLLFSFLFAVVSFSIVFSVDIIRLVFERGKFDSNDAESVALVFTIIVVMVPFVLIKDLSTRALFSQGEGISCLKNIFFFLLLMTGFFVLTIDYLEFLESLMAYVFFVILFSLYMYGKAFVNNGINEILNHIFIILKYLVISTLLSFIIRSVSVSFCFSAFIYLVSYSFIMFLIKDDSFIKLHEILSRRKNEKTV
ncbi:lipid II flippase MurJ [Vibrio vulnificus]|uniref:lipid II flippase MurJ n=2 Tax=Vibrio vulnificus TaxID=672 RepID=UPI001EEA9963|nr:lipid II flippase MurJ [Vibrio vulnificus]MCG6261880.1 hypothetical protein [Vibrio vulnificus]